MWQVCCLAFSAIYIIFACKDTTFFRDSFLFYEYLIKTHLAVKP